MTQHEPFDEFLPRRIHDSVLRRGRFVCLGLAREIDCFLYQRKIAGERRRGLLAGRILRRLRLAMGVGKLGVPAFANRDVAMGARLLRLVRLPGVLLLGILLLGIGPRCRLCREQGEGGEREDTGQRA
jgi:hypothetical protein